MEEGIELMGAEGPVEEDAAEEPADEKEVSSKEPAAPKKDGTAAVVHIKVSRRRLLISLGMCILGGLGIAAWQLRWYQPLWDRYNDASISIKVREGDTFALDKATILIDGKTFVTDSNGKANIVHIPAGTYHVSVSKEGYQPGSKDITLKKGENDLQFIGLAKLPEKSFSVVGFVKDYVSGKPVADVQVTLGSTTLVSDSSGEYKFEKVVPGDISLHLSKAGYKDMDLPQSVKDQDVSQASVPMVPVGKVIFVSNRDGKRGLYSSDYDGSTQKRLLPAGDGEDFAPVIAPTNKQLAFESTRDKLKDPYGTDLAKLYVVSADGTSLRKVSDDVSGAIVPMWSPDGRYLFYTAYTSAKEDTATYRIFDTQKNVLTDIGEAANGVVFSPDSAWAAYTVIGTQDAAAPTPAPTADAPATPVPSDTPAPVFQNSGTVNVAILKAFNLATGERKVLIQRQQNMSGLAFTADSSAVSYEAVVSGTRHRFQAVIASPGQESEVAVSDAPAGVIYAASPSGNSQAYVVERDGKHDLFISAKTGGQEQRLTTIGVADASVVPVWDATGKYVVFGVRREGENALYVVSTDGGDPHKVVDYYQEKQQ